MAYHLGDGHMQVVRPQAAVLVDHEPQRPYHRFINKTLDTGELYRPVKLGVCVILFPISPPGVMISELAGEPYDFMGLIAVTPAYLFPG